MASPTETSSDSRPAVAIIAVAQTPYRLHAHQRILREIPEIKLWSLFTHDVGDSAFPFETPPEIGPVVFAKNESSAHQRGLLWQKHEWEKGGRVIEWLKQNSIRAVMVQGYSDAGRVRIIRWCRRNGVPCYLFGDSNIRGDSASGLRAVIKKMIVSRVIAWSSGVMVCGRLGREYFAKYGAAADRMFDYPYEPDYSLIENLPAEKLAEAKERFDLRDGRRRIVFSGRFVETKRPEMLIEAFTRIAAHRPDSDLVMIGSGAMGDALREKIPPTLKSRVTWTGFLNDQSMVSAIYKQSDVLVLPSDYEPWALVINEAAAAGMAIVASSVVGAAAELVRDGVNGRIFPPGDTDALAACLMDVTADASIEAMKKASRDVLADWRKRGDPIGGWKAALKRSGLVR